MTNRTKATYCRNITNSTRILGIYDITNSTRDHRIFKSTMDNREPTVIYPTVPGMSPTVIGMKLTKLNVPGSGSQSPKHFFDFDDCMLVAHTVADCLAELVVLTMQMYIMAQRLAMGPRPKARVDSCEFFRVLIWDHTFEPLSLHRCPD